MSYYRHHVFFCCNQRDPSDPRGCCNAKGASRVRDHAKARVKALGLAGPGKVRVNQAGCLDRCALGPVMVVYPEGVWYTYVDEQDVDEIIDQHLVHGRVVERLRLPGGGS
jgi:(2Fe-2S) ferredoxin